MDVYIGMDISLQTTYICIVDSEGRCLQEGSAPSEVAALDMYLKKHGAGGNVKRIGFETGALSGHLYHGLKALGWPVVCMDARHAHGVLKAQRVKTDRNDARGLAQLVRTGWYRAVHVKSASTHALRFLVQGRKRLVESRLDLENHIRGVLKVFGVKLGTVSPHRFDSRIKEIVRTLDTLAASTFSALLEARNALWQQERILNSHSKTQAEQDDVCKRLMTIPGVGAQTALAYRAEIDDPARFRKSRDAGVHAGLTPRRYASGETDRTLGISKCGNSALRSLLHEAALTMLTRSKKWSRLKAWGVRLAQRSSFRNACIAVARKLAVIMHRMWVDGTEFVYGAPQASAA
jgi:transposase